MLCIPGKPLLWASATASLVSVLALALGAPLGIVAGVITGVLAFGFVLVGADLWLSLRQWHRHPLVLHRRLPAAMAIGVRSRVQLMLDLQGEAVWRGALHDHADAALRTDGLPARFEARGGTRVVLEYGALPLRRGDMVFAPAQLRLGSRLGLLELCVRAGIDQQVRAYPDFAQIARYAWLAGDRRLREIGIKNLRRRGAGTSFQQLAEYTAGDPVRHIDWKATLRHSKPIVRQFQDERDQNVWLLLDCGRRMRADDPDGPPGSAHFDQVLNAVMLLAYVALREGDGVGAFTFGLGTGRGRYIAPHKGRAQLGRLMGALYDVEPTLTQPDYLRAAEDFLAHQPRRALVIIITNFRDEDCEELQDALRLLRQRHLVMVASLREAQIDALEALPPTPANAGDIASAHLYAEARARSFARLGGTRGLLVDAEPGQLGVELVNRYQGAKRAGVL